MSFKEKMQSFKDQVAIITGSTDGIGLSTACLLAEAGAAVVINGRDMNKLQDAERKILLAANNGVLAFQGDITKKEVRESIVGETIKRFNRIDILINNVGGGTDVHRIEDVSDEEWQQSMDFNLNTCFAMCRTVISFMRTQKYGRIVNVSSLAGRFRGRLSGPHYSAAKAGMLGLTRHLAWDLAADGIAVNAVAPGFVETRRALEKWNRHSVEEKARFIEQIPLHRFANPEEIATAIVFLASPAASYITGATLDVNGGFYMI